MHILPLTKTGPSISNKWETVKNQRGRPDQRAVTTCNVGGSGQDQRAVTTCNVGGSGQSEDQSSVQLLRLCRQDRLGVVEEARELGLHLRAAQCRDQPQGCALNTGGRQRERGPCVQVTIHGAGSLQGRDSPWVCLSVCVCV